jgi:hypothetical protein
MQEIVPFHQYTLREGIEKDFMSAGVRVWVHWLDKVLALLLSQY